MLFFSKYLYIYQLILFQKVITCLLLNISMNNHENILCYKSFSGTCSSVEILKGYMAIC